MKAADPEKNVSIPSKLNATKSKVGINKQSSELEQRKFLLELYQKALLLSEKELNDYFLNHAVSLTGSTIGFFHFVSDDQKSIMLTAWNGEALKNCRANYSEHYPIESAGNWVDSLRLKQPVIYNDFAKSPNQKGCPSGHVLIKRFMSIPIIEAGKVKIIFGVGNKTDPYDEDDVVELQLIANELSKIYRQRQAENTLRESEEKYRALVETADDVILLTDLEGGHIFRNKAYFTSLGYEVGEEITLNGYANVHPDDLSVIKAKQIELLKQGSIASEYRVRHKNGSWVHRFAKSTVIYDQAHKPKAIMAIIRDITERKKAEEALRESEERFSKAFSSNPVALSISRLADGLIIDVNETYLRLFEFSRPEVIGHTSTELNIFTDQNERAKLTQQLQEKGALHNLDITFQTKTGKHINAIISIEKICFNNQDYIISTFVDVSERKKTEKKLEAYQKNLEKLVEERTKQLKDAERLAAIGATAGMVGHDIRNPLQAITGDVYLLKSELVSLNQSDQKNSIKESLDGIEKNIEYINKIVADLQDFARPLKPHVEEVDLKIIMGDLLSKNSLLQNVEVCVKVETEARKVVADCIYLNRIMNNLINNAVQAMPNGGKLTIEAYKDEKDVVVTVSDTGVGIPPEVKGKLFTPMFTTKSKGQGFGLPVVKRMTEALGGTVTFESQEGKGTTFTVRLPSKE